MFEGLALALLLVAAGELVRYLSWIGRDSTRDSRIFAWLVPGARNLPTRGAAQAFREMQSRFRPAAAMPLGFGPMLAMRPPADIATVLVASAVIWWTGLAAIGIVRARMEVRHIAFALEEDPDLYADDSEPGTS